MKYCPKKENILLYNLETTPVKMITLVLIKERPLSLTLRALHCRRTLHSNQEWVWSFKWIKYNLLSKLFAYNSAVLRSFNQQRQKNWSIIALYLQDSSQIQFLLTKPFACSDPQKTISPKQYFLASIESFGQTIGIPESNSLHSSNMNVHFW